MRYCASGRRQAVSAPTSASSQRDQAGEDVALEGVGAERRAAARSASPQSRLRQSAVTKLARLAE